MKLEKIVLKDQMYATPKTESVEIVNQGVLCNSAVAEGNFKLGVNSGGLN